MAAYRNGIWHVYIDETLEEIPRAFYIGKGTDRRFFKKDRNTFWKNISVKYGSRRSILLSTKDEEYAFEMEIYFIKKYKTFQTDWPDGIGFGANFTPGGEGRSGYKVSEETKLKISTASTGRKHTPESKLKISIAHTGKFVSEETRLKQSKARDSIVISPETCKKMSESHIGLLSSPETKQKLSEMNTGEKHPFFGGNHSEETKEKFSEDRKGEGNSRAILTFALVKEIRNKYASGGISQRQLAREYGVSKGCITQLLYYRSWKVDSNNNLL